MPSALRSTRRAASDSGIPSRPATASNALTSRLASRKVRRSRLGSFVGLPIFATLPTIIHLSANSFKRISRFPAIGVCLRVRRHNASQVQIDRQVREVVHERVAARDRGLVKNGADHISIPATATAPPRGCAKGGWGGWGRLAGFLLEVLSREKEPRGRSLSSPSSLDPPIIPEADAGPNHTPVDLPALVPTLGEATAKVLLARPLRPRLSTPSLE